MNLIEKIIAAHSKQDTVSPGEIIDVLIDARVARDFGGANVVKNLLDNHLTVDDAARTYFTFDCNPGGSDQKYAANQHFCRLFARDNGIQIYDVDAGIGTHLAIDNGMAWPGSTFVSTDSHANIMGAIGAFGQGMGDMDIAATWARGSVWFKVPASVKLVLTGVRPQNLSAKDIVLNLLKHFGANKLLGYSVEMHGPVVDDMGLDERVTIASMATEMGAIILLFPTNNKVLDELEQMTGKRYDALVPDDDASYDEVFSLDVSSFSPMVANPGHPHDDIELSAVAGKKIDSAFIGSCTNGRINDLRAAAAVLKGKRVAPGVVLKIVPSTDKVWMKALDEGLIKIFKDAGALVSNAGCAGCAAGQVGQNGPEEVTISTGNRNFSGKQGKGFVYLASPATVAASAVAGVIAGNDNMPSEIAEFTPLGKFKDYQAKVKPKTTSPKMVVEGRVWVIRQDDIDTDMIFHNRYLTITDIAEMGKYTFDNLKGYEDFAQKAKAGDIVITTKNFGAGSSRQQAVDCFKSLGIQCIIAASFGAIYERNAINAAFPILTYEEGLLEELSLEQGNHIRLDYSTGEIENLSNGKKSSLYPFNEVQEIIFQRGGLL